MGKFIIAMIALWMIHIANCLSSIKNDLSELTLEFEKRFCDKFDEYSES